MENDLGIAVLRYLIEEKRGLIGYHFTMNDFVNNYIRSQNDVSEMNTWIAREVIFDLVSMGYVSVSAPNDDGLYNYGRPEGQHRGQVGFTHFSLGITWKGKAFYYEHLNKGVLSKREWLGFVYMAILSTIGVIAAIAALFKS